MVGIDLHGSHREVDDEVVVADGAAATWRPLPRTVMHGAASVGVMRYRFDDVSDVGAER